jgi:hypothetical protein
MMLLGGGAAPATARSQGHQGEGRSARFTLVTGIPGSTADTQTLYVIDDTNELLFTFEYNAVRRKDKMTPQAVTDLRKYIHRAVELRAEARQKDKDKKK